jgi:hypothetical protein
MPGRKPSILLLATMAVAIGVAAFRLVRPHGAVEADVAPALAIALPLWWHVILRVLVTVGFVGLILFVLLLFFEGRFVFHPRREGARGEPPPGVQACFFRTPDGERLQAWWHPGAGEPSGCPVLLWCHGGGGNMRDRAGRLQALADAGLAVLLFDYRGYGHSEGNPSEHGLYVDAQTAHRYLTSVRGVAPERIVALGTSLGAAVALHVALRLKVAGLVMESAAESVPAVARRRLLYLPVASLMRYRFDNLDRIGRLKVPLLAVHGGADRRVPVAQGKAVFDAATGPKSFHLIESAGHSDLAEVGGEAYMQTLTQFCGECVARRGA